jgi:hypothetical protein
MHDQEPNMTTISATLMMLNSSDIRSIAYTNTAAVRTRTCQCGNKIAPKQSHLELFIGYTKYGEHNINLCQKCSQDFLDDRNLENVIDQKELGEL